MHKILIAGAGTIGKLMALSLAHSGDYAVFLIDNNLAQIDLPSHPHILIEKLDVTDAVALQDYLRDRHIETAVSTLPYFYTLCIARAAASLDLNYFDLTEDVEVVAEVRSLAKGKSKLSVSHCGVAPGFVSIVANYLMSSFDTIYSAKLRAGNLPQTTQNALHYAIAWSLDGLINEYDGPCDALVDSKKTVLEPLEGLESVIFDGKLFEAFNTSGGVGTLVESYQGRVQTLDYKTLRYPGHCEKMRFLMKDLKLNKNRAVLRNILENYLPSTEQDMLLIYVAVTGEKNGRRLEKNYVKKIMPTQLHGRRWTAIQVSTASSACTVIDLLLRGEHQHKGFIFQEQISFDDFIKSSFSSIYLG